MKRAAAWLVACALTACGATETAESENPLRTSLERAIAALDSQKPLQLRYNPAACACPPMEAEIAGHWLRAELSGAKSLQPWLAGAARTPPEGLPVQLKVLGRVEPELFRTVAGSYAVRVDVASIVAAKPDPPPPPGQ